MDLTALTSIEVNQLVRGFHAARSWYAGSGGQPFDAGEPSAWQEGYRLWEQTHADAGHPRRGHARRRRDASFRRPAVILRNELAAAVAAAQAGGRA